MFAPCLFVHILLASNRERCPTSNNIKESIEVHSESRSQVDAKVRKLLVYPLSFIIFPCLYVRHVVDER